MDFKSGRVYRLAKFKWILIALHYWRSGIGQDSLRDRRYNVALIFSFELLVTVIVLLLRLSYEDCSPAYARMTQTYYGACEGLSIHATYLIRRSSKTSRFYGRYSETRYYSPILATLYF
jgi:uncharacterized membrane protein